MTTTFGDIKTKVTSRLNNGLMTDALAAEFVKDAMTRINRTLRVPSMERKLTLTVGSDSDVTLPQDFLQMRDLIVLGTGYGNLKMHKAERGVWENADDDAGGTVYLYTRIGSKYYMKPTVAAGENVEIIYWADAITLDDDTDVDPLFNVAEDLVTYAALVYAADHFQDERRNLWDATFKELLLEVQAQADMQEMTEGYLSVAAGTPLDY